MNANLQAALIDAENGKRAERRELMREYGSLIYQREQTPADASRIQATSWNRSARAEPDWKMT